MLSTILAPALLGLAASAAPNPGNWGGRFHGHNDPHQTWAPPPYTTVSTAPNAAQTPFSFPLTNGFPTNLNDDTIAQIEKIAHGLLPNGALPSSISNTSGATFSLIAFNELFEVAYFTSLIYNITNNVPGYEVGSYSVRTIVLNALYAVQAQEELHALGANGILKAAGRTPIVPCEYVFPVDNFDDAIALAATFTDVVLGTLQDALNNFATDGDAEFVPLIGSVIGQEGEQNGFYRNLLNAIPSAKPFLTRSTAQFAFSALNQNFVVAGSCPANFNLIPLPVFGALGVSPATPDPVDQTLTFTVKPAAGTTLPASFSIVYINGQDVPIQQMVRNVQTASDGTTTFTAFFPYTANQLDGLTIAALVAGSSGNFSSAPAVANATLFGPGLIEV